MYLHFLKVARSIICPKLIHSHEINVTLFKDAVKFQSVACMGCKCTVVCWAVLSEGDAR